MAPPTESVPVVGRGAPRAAPVEAPRPKLEVVRPARKFRPGLVSTVVGTLFFATLFTLAAMQAVLVQGQLKLDRIDRDIAARQDDVERLRVQVATLETPARIQQAAIGNGLVPPPEILFLAPATADPVPFTPMTTSDAATAEAEGDEAGVDPVGGTPPDAAEG